MGAKSKLLLELKKRIDGGDELAMDYGSRMQRSNEQGFNRDIYHKTWGENFGDGEGFTEFAKDKMQQSDYGYAGKGVYATTKPLGGSTYGNVTMPLKTNIKNPYLRTEDNWQDELDPYQWIPKNKDNYGSMEETSEAWTKMMQDQGYDGMVDDMAGGEINIFDPSNIRSVNAAFDPAKKDSSNLLASVGAGVTGTAALTASDDSDASFIGMGAKTWNKGAEQLAKKMEAQGSDRHDIWQATGDMGAPMFRDVDGYLKQEIDDSKMLYTQPVKGTGKNAEEGYRLVEASREASDKNISLEAELVGFNGSNDEYRQELLRQGYQKIYDIKSDGFKTSDVINNPNLSAAYSDIDNQTVKYRDSIGFGGADGEYNSLNNTITVKPDNPDNKSIMSHELQHAIQKREGFARGGSPEMFDRDISLYDLEMKALGIKDTLDDLGPDASKADISKAYKDFWDEPIDENLIPYAQMTDRDLIQNRVNKYHETLGGLPETVDKVEAYKRLAGEAEARNGQERLDFDMQKRKAIPPWQTRDIAQRDLIVRGNKPAAAAAGALTGSWALSSYGQDRANDAVKYGVPQFIEAEETPNAEALANLIDKWTKTPADKVTGRRFGGTTQYFRDLGRKQSLGTKVSNAVGLALDFLPQG